MDVKIAQDWKEILSEEFEKTYFKNLAEFVKAEYTSTACYPNGAHIFNAFDSCSFKNLKVVVLGQDPYHGKGQANGLSFSVQKGIRKPPSLQNIFKELSADLDLPIPEHGDLSAWANQGVLMLNATLTVRASQPGSHQNKGWEEYTDAVIRKISELKQRVVFILWGNYAQKKGEVIDHKKHFVIKSAHPSPFAAHRGFFGSKPFSKTNEFLAKHGDAPIDWEIH